MPGWITKLIGGNKSQSPQEIEEETERLEAEDRKAGVELSLEQKRVAAKMLRERGVSINHFGSASDEGAWAKAVRWLKEH